MFFTPLKSGVRRLHNAGFPFIRYQCLRSPLQLYESYHMLYEYSHFLSQSARAPRSLTRRSRADMSAPTTTPPTTTSSAAVRLATVEGARNVLEALLEKLPDMLPSCECEYNS